MYQNDTLVAVAGIKLHDHKVKLLFPICFGFVDRNVPTNNFKNCL